MTEDLSRLLGASALGDSLDRLRILVTPRREVPGWGTVDLDRAESTVTRPAGRFDATLSTVDAALGATGRRLPGTDGEFLLLEPSTEGRLAAALARHGEGVLVLYLLVEADAPARARAGGFRLQEPSPGPFGSECLVLGGPRWGPFLILAGWD